jgi:hypothetical protein
MSESGPTERAAGRHEVFGLGVVLAPDVSANCVIRDLSSTGAKLGISRRVKLPPKFKVALLKTNTMRNVVLKWRRGDFVGVEFCPRRGSHSKPPRLACSE